MFASHSAAADLKKLGAFTQSPTRAMLDAAEAKKSLLADAMLDAAGTFDTKFSLPKTPNTACGAMSPNSQSTRLSFVATLCWRAFQRVVDYFGF